MLKLFNTEEAVVTVCVPFFILTLPVLVCATCYAWTDLASLLPYLHLTFHWSLHTSRKAFLASAGTIRRSSLF